MTRCEGFGNIILGSYNSYPNLYYSAVKDGSTMQIAISEGCFNPIFSEVLGYHSEALSQGNEILGYPSETNALRVYEGLEALKNLAISVSGNTSNASDFVVAADTLMYELYLFYPIWLSEYEHEIDEVVDVPDDIQSVSCDDIVNYINTPFSQVPIESRQLYIDYLISYIEGFSCINLTQYSNNISSSIDSVTNLVISTNDYQEYDDLGGGAGSIVQSILSVPFNSPNNIRKSLASFIYAFLTQFSGFVDEEEMEQFQHYFQHLGVSMVQAEQYIYDNIVSEEPISDNLLQDDCPTCPNLIDLKGSIKTSLGDIFIVGEHNIKTGKTTFKSAKVKKSKNR